MELKDFILNRNLFLPFVISLITVIFAIVLNKSSKLKKESPLSPLKFLMAGTFISSFSLFLPAYIQKGNALMAIVDSLIDSIKLFGFNHHTDYMKDMVFVTGDYISYIDKAFIAFITFLPPLLTVIAALNIFKDTVAQLKYGLSFGKNVHVFSQLNSKSICLAKDIKQNEKSSVIVFLNTKSETDSQDLLSEAKSIKALLSKKSVFDFHCMIHRNPSVYFIDNNESDNVKYGVEFYKKHKDKSSEILVFSSLESSESFIDAIDKKDAVANIKLINYAEIIAYNLLLKKPMFSAADNCNSKTMSVLVIGANTVGTEFIKAAMWCGVMNTYRFSLKIIGSHEQKKQFEANYYSLKNAFKKINVNMDYEFLEAELNSSDFREHISRCMDSKYIVISADNDELTVNTATKFNVEYIRNAIKAKKNLSDCKPTIIPIVSNINYYDLLHEHKDVFYPYGSYKEIYKAEIINDWSIDNMAKHIHYLYSDKNPSAYKVYNTLPEKEKRSNRATAVHYFYKMKDLGIDFCNSDNHELKRQYIENGKKVLSYSELRNYIEKSNKNAVEMLSVSEHNRWSIFQFINGWEPYNITDIEYYNNKAERKSGIHKMSDALYHGCLVPYKELEILGNKLYGNPEHFKEHDRKVTSLIEENIFEIIDKNQSENNPRFMLFINKEETEQ